MQLIRQGKTNRCHPTNIEFPEGFNITQTKNHWSNEDKVIKHLESIIFSFAKSKRSELGFKKEQKGMLIFDAFKPQCTQRVFDLIDENHWTTVFVAANLAHAFQPLDLANNGVPKSSLKSKFSGWYSKEIAKALDMGQDIHEVKVDNTLTVMKPTHAQWIIALYDCLRNDVELTKKSFKEAEITSAVEEEIEPVDPFKDLD